MDGPRRPLNLAEMLLAIVKREGWNWSLGEENVTKDNQ
jgi:hypothetical protein